MVREGRLTLAHVGDSRAYLLRQGDLTQLSEDHSWVGEMVRRGDLTPAQAAVHPHRSVITRRPGHRGGHRAPTSPRSPSPRATASVICSDGLTGMVPDTDLLELLEQGLDAQATAELLVKAALAGGGEDNVTVVVIDVLAGEGEKTGRAGIGSLLRPDPVRAERPWSHGGCLCAPGGAGRGWSARAA